MFEIAAHVLRQLEERRVAQRGLDVGGSGTRDLVGATRGPLEALVPDEVADRMVAGMSRLQVEVEDAHDAFLLDPGMGPMAYLTRDGRVLHDHRTWDGDDIAEVTGDDAITTIVAGAKNTGIAELLSLLPAAPAEAAVCPKCRGERWADIAPGWPGRHVCLLCRGRGWALLPEITSARERGIFW